MTIKTTFQLGSEVRNGLKNPSAMTNHEVIGRFHALYSGGLAQSLRDAGDSSATPPWADTYWLGKQVVKCPMDLWVYQEIIVATRPELILETGTSGAGSAWFFASVMDAANIPGRILTVDTVFYPHLCIQHPRIEYLTGDSVSEEIAAQFRAAVVGRRTMVSLDSLHTYEHVRKELNLYGQLTSPGCYLVIEDTGFGDGASAAGEWCDRAAFEFVRDNPGFIVDKSCEKHLLTSNHNGWLKRIA